MEHSEAIVSTDDTSLLDIVLVANIMRYEIVRLKEPPVEGLVLHLYFQF